MQIDPSSSHRGRTQASSRCGISRFGRVSTSGILVLFALTSFGYTPSAEAWPKRKNKKDRAASVSKTPFEPTEKWEAYIKDEDGHRYHLQQPVEKNSDEDWMTLEFTDFTGNRSRIAVWKVQDEIGLQSAETSHQIGFWQVRTRSSVAPLKAVEELLMTSIFNSNRFEVIERKQLETILAEQDFGESGRVTTQSAAQIGRSLGADYILFSSINEWTPKKRSRGTVGFGKSVAEVAVSMRVVDTETAEVTYASTFRATSSNRSIRVPFFGQQDVAPVNYAMAACINKAVYDLATSLKVRPWRGAVVDVAGDLVTLNGGENRGVAKGQIFRAVRKGKAMIDPESGKSLGFRQEVIGTLKVTSVMEKMATAVVTEGCEGLKVGDFVQPLESDSPSR